MLAELCQITSILSNVCIILGVSWLAIKYFQFKKILYIIKMATDQIDQLLQDAVQDATLANFTAANISADISADTSKEKEKINSSCCQWKEQTISWQTNDYCRH